MVIRVENSVRSLALKLHFGYPVMLREMYTTRTAPVAFTVQEVSPIHQGQGEGHGAVNWDLRKITFYLLFLANLSDFVLI